MRRKLTYFLVFSLLIMLATPVCLAAATVEGSGSQTRGTPGHNAELKGSVFTVPGNGTITDIAGEGTAGFWIERDNGNLVANFDSFAQAQGFRLPPGNYRVFPNLKESPKANYAWVRITVTCP